MEQSENRREGVVMSAPVADVSGAAAAPAAGFLARSFDHWKKAAHALGVVQTRFLMFGIYVALVIPTGVLMRFFRDPLHLGRREGTNWTPTHSETPSLETARRQF